MSLFRAEFAVLRAVDAVAAAEELGGPVWVVKSQIHAGGRGKGKFKEPEAGSKGGVRLAKSVAEVETYVGQMLGRTLVTVQTGPAGKQVNRIYLEEGATIVKEFYLSLLVDRSASRVAFVVSTEGGMDIEEVAHQTPGTDHKFHGRSGNGDHAAPRPHRRQGPRPCPAISPNRRKNSPRSSIRPLSPRIWPCSKSIR